jgi:hypothetical protein
MLVEKLSVTCFPVGGGAGRGPHDGKEGTNCFSEFLREGLKKLVRVPILSRGFIVCEVVKGLTE